MDFVWVRWYGLDPDSRYKFGWKARRLPRIGFIEDSNNASNASAAFGFIDPATIVRARLAEDGDYDWNFFYVNIFLDRDMMMRYRGGGVGHTSTRDATNRFLDDRHATDVAMANAALPDEEPDLLDSDLESSDSNPDSEMTGLQGVSETIRDLDELEEGGPEFDDAEEEGDEEEEDYDYGGAGNSEGEEGDDLVDALPLDACLDEPDDSEELEGEMEQLGYARY